MIGPIPRYTKVNPVTTSASPPATASTAKPLAASASATPTTWAGAYLAASLDVTSELTTSTAAEGISHSPATSGVNSCTSCRYCVTNR